MEFREEMSAFVRSYAVNQFDKEFPMQDKEAFDAQKQVLENVNTVQELYKPRRYYRRTNTPPSDLQSRVQITMLEYGLHGDARSTSKSPGTDSFEERQTEEVFIEQF